MNKTISTVEFDGEKYYCLTEFFANFGVGDLSEVASSCIKAQKKDSGLKDRLKYIPSKGRIPLEAYASFKDLVFIIQQSDAPKIKKFLQTGKYFDDMPN